MSLKNYRQKRQFNKTPEPKGKIRSKRIKNLYVIQKHAASHLHYDFRLELNGVLLSWAIPKGPSLDPNVKRLAVHVEDHPVEYGSFEGSIPKGQYGGGTVMLWDKGEWSPEDDDPTKAYHKGNLSFSLKGKKLKGDWKLIRIHSDPKNWLLVKINDQYAKPLNEYDILQTKNKSVLSNKTIEKLTKDFNLETKPSHLKKATLKINLKKIKMPQLVKPQLAILVDRPPNGISWLHEIKFDGYRLVSFVKNNKARLITRGNQDWTSKFKEIAIALQKLPIKNAIFDGEIVALDEKQRSNFQLLQNSIQNHDNQALIYYIFDLIYYDQYDLSTLPLIKRKEILASILSDDPLLRYSDHVLGSGNAIYKESCKLGLEGIISKNVHSHYLEKRTKNWLKIKCSERQEFVIVGYTLPQRNRKYFGSLLLGAYNKNKKLIYCGHVGTGFNDQSLTEIYKELKKNITEKIPFEKLPPNSKKVLWVKPILVAEVEFTEWTDEGVLRHPSFKGLRKDKSAKNVGFEKMHKLKGI